MKTRIGFLVIGPFALIGAPTATAWSAPTAITDVPFMVAAADPLISDRETFTQRARNDMRDWQRKLRDFDVRAKAAGRETDGDLDAAWAKADAAARKLKTATDEEWENAKASFQIASRDLAARWDRIQKDHQ